jgi:DNA-binding Xre family transcriptional regulator
MNPQSTHFLNTIRTFILLMLAAELGCKPADIAERFYFGAIEKPMEYPL